MPYNLPERLKLYLVTDRACYSHSEAIVGVFFTEEKARQFLQTIQKKDEYCTCQIEKLEFNTQNGEV